MVLVDSSVWMEAARRDGRLECKIGLEALIAEAEALICGPVRMEVLAGAHPTDRPMLSAGFDSIPYRSMKDEEWREATEFAGTVADHGLHLPFRAILMASLARKWDCRIYTLDSDFQLIPGILEVQLYHPGYGGKFQPDLRRYDNRPSGAPQLPVLAPSAAGSAHFSSSTLDIGVWD